MSFPDDYPFNPPTFRFDNEFYHPNGNLFYKPCFYVSIYSTCFVIVYPDGRLCISILHPPGEDPISGEKAEVNN